MLNIAFYEVVFKEVFPSCADSRFGIHHTEERKKTWALLNFSISLFSNEAKAKIDDILVSIVLVYYHRNQVNNLLE